MITESTVLCHIPQPEAVVKTAQDHTVPLRLASGGCEDGPDLAVGKWPAFLRFICLVRQPGDALGLVGVNQVVLKGIGKGRLDTVQGGVDAGR